MDTIVMQRLRSLPESPRHSIAKTFLISRTRFFRFLLLPAGLIVAAGLALPSTACADNYYVSPDGSDERTADEARNRSTPWQSIQKGVDSLSPGDTLIVKDGEYQEHVRIFSGGREDASIKIRAQNRHAAKIRGSIGGSGVDHVLISDLEIVNDQDDNTEMKGIAFYGCHHIRIVGNRVHDCRGGGICIDQSDWILIDGNETFRNARQSPDQHSGISVYQPRPSDDVRDDQWGIVIINNISYHNLNEVPNRDGELTDGNGIILDDFNNTQTDDPRWTGKPYPRRTYVANNICYSNGGRGIHCYLANDVYIQNNTTRANMANLQEGAEISAVDSQRIRITNNIMMPREGHPAARQHESSAFWDFNLIAAESGQEADQERLIEHGTGTIFADPKFDEDTFRISADSAAVDAGTEPTLELPEDFSGNPRVHGAAIDIGAIEWNG